MSANDPRWLVPFSLVLVLLAGWLIALHLAPVHVPSGAQDSETVPVAQDAPLIVCDSVSAGWRADWLAGPVLARASVLLEEHRYSFGPLESAACDTCVHGAGRTPCLPGRVVVSEAPRGVQGETHVGDTRAGDGWRSILLPRDPPELPIDPDEFRSDQASLHLPPDWRALTLAHERLHAADLWHARAAVWLGPAPKGHILHPSIYHLGDDFRGVPTP